MANNKRLGKAKTGKNDEFYTQLSDIENELRHYKAHFQGKTVLCNCDDPRVSNFTKYFILNFRALGLKKLITTCYKNQDIDLFSTNSCEKAVYMVYTGTENSNSIPTPEEIGVKELKGDGDFRSAECIELLKEADIVVTNPPFSLFREYVAQLIKYDKKFIIIGHINALKYLEVFPLLQNNIIWCGYGFKISMVLKTPYENTLEANRKYVLSKGYNPDDNFLKTPAIAWYTNLDIQKRHEDIVLFKSYNPIDYPTYENFNAIDVAKVSDIPFDYDGIMGVPITFMGNYNPEQFEILGNCCDTAYLREVGFKPVGQKAISMLRAQGNKAHVTANMPTPYVIRNGIVELPYARILIKRK